MRWDVMIPWLVTAAFLAGILLPFGLVLGFSGLADPVLWGQ